MKKTKIVCTIGPASESVETLTKLMNAGMNVARLNFSHGSHEEHLQRIKNIHEAEAKVGKTVALMLDTKGPEIRTHDMEDGKILLEKGAEVRVSMKQVLGTKDRFSITYPELIHDVKEGSRILIDDGLVELRVTGIDKENEDIVATVVNSGVIKNKKGINVPGVQTKLPGITEKDREDIIFGLGQDIDLIAASFVRKAGDVLEIRELLEQHNMSHVLILPKIECQEGLDNIDEILEVSDGLMVARGDLGVEIPAEEVPIEQKRLIKKCNILGKPVITATQMLDSMQRNPRPTRAEAGDVANAIFDGTDAVMLSGETAAGDWPVEAVTTMANICVRTEAELSNTHNFKMKTFSETDVAEAIGRSVGHTARNLKIATIVAATESGHTARMISKYRPNTNIVAVTFSERVKRSLMVSWGVQPYMAKKPATTDDMFELATQVATKEGFATEGDLILITAGVPVGERGTTNIMKVQAINTELLRGNGVGRHSYVGKAVIAHSAEEANSKLSDGGILVVENTNSDYTEAIRRSGGVIVETGGLTSHAAILGIELHIPVIVGAKDACQLIEDGGLVTIDPRRGIVYKGKTTAF
ncbi:pyruvate kinase [Atopobacter sp. AH10]|uniref:pyruvate kinase n=1 Tax=Atopobacter sp. AH10 TaxID=2315861 RepID=UPI000EF2600E|nr:pyruvate kinase [Atopobacter sp. AH10]RLK63224.1 pyruvate kinase [Atopobacter sp. AH10]